MSVEYEEAETVAVLEWLEQHFSLVDLARLAECHPHRLQAIAGQIHFSQGEIETHRQLIAGCLSELAGLVKQ